MPIKIKSSLSDTDVLAAITSIYKKYNIPSKRGWGLLNLLQQYSLSNQAKQAVTALLAGEQAVINHKFKQAITFFSRHVRDTLIKMGYKNHEFLTDKRGLKSSYKYALEEAYKSKQLSLAEFNRLLHDLAGEEKMEKPEITTDQERAVYTIDRVLTPEVFEILRSKTNIVCAGDSITGWNNFGAPSTWPFQTYPQFLQEILQKEKIPLKVANGGVAGEVSANGIGLVKQYLSWFPNAEYYVLGFGTNDLAYGALESTSRSIINNLETMCRLVNKSEKKPILLNVPYVNEQLFPKHIAEQTHIKRDYHNRKLAERFAGKIPIVDICSKLKDRHLGDNLHPNESGARIIANTVYLELAKKI